MTLKSLTKHFPKFQRRGLKALSADQSGVSAIEFALIAPFMVALYLGGIELSLLMQADRRVTSSTATIGDLTSRFTTIDDGEMGDIFASVSHLILPLDPLEARMRVSSLIIGNNGTLTVDWSYGCGTDPRAEGSTVDDLPAELIGTASNSNSVILAEVEYEYTPLFGSIRKTASILSDRFVLRPRRTDSILRTNGGGSLPPECLNRN